MSIVIDSTTYNIPFKVVNRKADLLFKDGAGRTEDGVLHAEILGVYYNYDLEMGMSANNVSDYAALWVKLTEPVNLHEITLPDESGTLTFDCYFANIKDTVIKQGATNYFRNLTFSVIAIFPARTPA
jgi:hypothetical protein